MQSDAPRLRAADVHTAIDKERLTGRIRHASRSKLSDRIANVLRLAPAGHGETAGFDPAVVLVEDVLGHVGLDDAWPNLVNGDSIFGKTHRIQGAHHSHASL